MRLGIVFAISYISFDKLAAYGGLMMLSSLIILVIYFIYCKKNYEECKLHFYFEKNLFKEILSFSGWSLFGASVGVARGAITNILLNMFFGPVVNAARAVANQISNGVSSFSNIFLPPFVLRLLKILLAIISIA
jgi:O-antigen/teichoic acid export membrane protein